MHRFVTRRSLTAGITALYLTATTARAATCAWPQWADDLRARLDAMAQNLTATLKPWQGPATIFLPQTYGATTPLATAAIQAAIDAAHAAGGGTVRLTQGDYISGTLDLKSHVRLEVAKGARLLGSLDLNDYPDRIARRPTVMDSNMGMNQSLIFAEDCEDISICGEGTIDGRGANFHGAETPHATPGRPFVIRVIDCRRIHIDGITLLDSPCWMQNYLNCDDLLVENITVENQANFNNDGIDIDGCRRVIVRKCYISSGDDALCFKGAAQTPGEQILVEQCTFYSSCNAIKFGTDSQSPFRDVLVRHCEIGGVSDAMRHVKPVGADAGLSWEMVDGGIVENIQAHDIHIVRARSPLFLRLEDRARVRPEQPRPPVGTMRRIVFDRITGEDSGPRGSYFIGIPEKAIEDIALRHIHIKQRPSTKPILNESIIPELKGVYPDAHMIDDISPGLGGDAPAYALWTRHVTGVTLIDYKVTPTGPDPRPAFVTTTDSTVCGV